MSKQPLPAKTELTFAAADVAAEFARWLEHLAAERRMSPKTCEAYCRDATQFLLFLGEHLGGRVTLNKLAQLTPQDVRAFMAARRPKPALASARRCSRPGVRP